MTRRISWVRAALRDFSRFPEEVQLRMTRALEIAADGEMADSAKPMTGVGSGVFEIVVPYRRDAFPAVYSVKIGPDV
jgi:phage-related protein